MKTLRFSLTTLLLLCSTLFVTAQNQQEQPYELNIRLRFYNYGGGNLNDLYYMPQPNLYEPVSMGQGSRSAFYPLKGNNPFQLYRVQVDAEGNHRYYPVASTHIDPAIREALIFVLPTGSTQAGKKEFHLAALDDSRNSIPDEHVTFFNATGQRLLGRVGDKRIVLDSGLSSPIALSSIRDERERVFIGLGIAVDNEIVPVMSNHARILPERRALIVLMPPKTQGSYEITAFTIIEMSANLLKRIEASNAEQSTTAAENQ